MKATIVIGFAEALSAPEVAWSLLDHGLEVIAFARKGRRSALRYSRLIRVIEITAPESDAAEAAREMLSAIEILARTCKGPLALMPIDDQALWLCGKLELPAGIVLVGPQGSALTLALDKDQQIERALAAGFHVPSSISVSRVEEIPATGLGFPVVFKPSMAAADCAGVLTRGQGWICADRAELDRAVRQWNGRGRMVLQQFVAGVGEGIFGLATAQGVVAWSAHRRLRMMNPQGSGSSACIPVTEIDAQTQSATQQFLNSCGWRGLFMIELLRDQEGQLWFIEFNGRSWGSMALARRTGLEYPAWAVQIAFKPELCPVIPHKRQRVAICRHLAREILHVLFVARGSRTRALTEWPSFWFAFSQVCRVGRRDRWYNWRWSDPKVFFGDLVETLWNQCRATKSSL